MLRIANRLSELIDNTPLLRLERLAADLGGEVLAKLEYFTPSGSNKDRVVLAMLEDAKRRGALQPNTVIIEPTSGNIAFSLAMLAVPRGYRVILVMPDGIPLWRIHLLRAMGAEVVLSPAAYGMAGARAQAERLIEQHDSVFHPNQFANLLNIQAQTVCAEEIWEVCEGKLGAVVLSVSTAGSLTGIGGRLKTLSQNRIRVFAVEPTESPLLSGGQANRHQLLGMGAPFVPENYEATLVDEIISISDHECHQTLLRLYRTEGIMSGPTGAAAVAAALNVAARPEFANERIVTVIPDHIERYTGLYAWDTAPVLMPTIVNVGN